MKVSILDDWFDTLRTLRCFDKLAAHNVTIWNDHVQDIDALAERLHACEALVLIRERTEIRTPLLERLTELRLISQRSVYPHIDIDTCTRLGIVVSSRSTRWHAVLCGGRADVGADARAMRQIPQQMASLKAGNWQMGVGDTLARQDAGHLRLRANRQGRRRVRACVRHERPGLGARGVAGEADADGHAVAGNKQAFFERAT